jgi:DNA-binding response OmpR family regulator
MNRNKNTKVADVLAAQKRILLVDDDRTVRDSLSHVLVTEGYVVIPAEHGEQALQLAAHTRIDLVLLDLNMPVKNGWDTFEQLSREQPLIPIIIVTARPNQLFTAVGAGVGALLEKPLDIRILLHTIARLLAEPTEHRLARLAGQKAEFYYAAAPEGGSVEAGREGSKERKAQPRTDPADDSLPCSHEAV